MTSPRYEALMQAANLCQQEYDHLYAMCLDSEPEKIALVLRNAILTLRDAVPQSGQNDKPASEIDSSYALSLADAIAACRVTCKHEPSGFDLEQQGYDTIIRALRFFTKSQPPASASAKVPQEPAVPEGWQLVPMKPTPKMLIAGLRWMTWQRGYDVEEAFKEMLAAAPASGKGEG